MSRFFSRRFDSLTAASVYTDCGLIIVRILPQDIRKVKEFPAVVCGTWQFTGNVWFAALEIPRRFCYTVYQYESATG